MIMSLTDLDLARLPRVWMVLEMSVSVRDVHGSFTDTKTINITHVIMMKETERNREEAVYTPGDAAAGGRGLETGWQEQRNGGR